jgi:hypothetical protein
MEIQDAHKEILALCANDDTGLWLVLRRICGDEYYFGTIPHWLRQKAINIIRDLLSSGLIVAGNFEVGELEKHRFIPMLIPVNEIVEFIEQEWNSLGRTPSLGDICWFRATETGENFAKTLSFGSS